VNAFYTALKSYYKAQEDEAIAVLQVYFNSPVGVGDHSNLMEDLKKWTQVLTDARENSKTLEGLFQQAQQQVQQQGEEQ
tara:strand:+ start:1720 stop:1956 length:237 start_codon:yes stop_codon:yes gene_type:complete